MATISLAYGGARREEAWSRGCGLRVVGCGLWVVVGFAVSLIAAIRVWRLKLAGCGTYHKAGMFDD